MLPKQQKSLCAKHFIALYRKCILRIRYRHNRDNWDREKSWIRGGATCTENGSQRKCKIWNIFQLLRCKRKTKICAALQVDARCKYAKRPTAVSQPKEASWACSCKEECQFTKYATTQIRGTCLMPHAACRCMSQSVRQLQARCQVELCSVISRPFGQMENCLHSVIILPSWAQFLSAWQVQMPSYSKWEQRGLRIVGLPLKLMHGLQDPVKS